jgi:hypothetical protein
MNIDAGNAARGANRAILAAAAADPGSKLRRRNDAREREVLLPSSAGSWESSSQPFREMSWHSSRAKFLRAVPEGTSSMSVRGVDRK